MERTEVSEAWPTIAELVDMTKKIGSSYLENNERVATLEENVIRLNEKIDATIEAVRMIAAEMAGEVREDS